MKRKTLEDISTSLAGDGHTGPVEARVDVLEAVVRDLLMEVEALRQALLHSAPGSGGKQSTYANAYREIGLLAHNSSGPTSGLEKLLARFYKRAGEQREAAYGREILMLRRLGFTEADVEAYAQEAENAEQLT
jgi:hypothetical protein